MRTCEDGCNGCDDCTDYEPRKAMMTDKTGPSDLYRSLTEPEGWRERDKASAAAFVDAMPEVRDAHLGGYSYEASMLRDLLALIHQDGGDCVGQHGLDKALEAAQAKVARWSAAMNEATTRELHAAQEADELRASLKAVLSHWREFGPEHGFDECVERAAAWALGPNVQIDLETTHDKA